MQLLLSYPDPFYFWVSLDITKQQQQYNLGTTPSRVDCWAGSTSEEEPTTQNYLCNLHSGHLHTKMIILPYLVIKSFFFCNSLDGEAFGDDEFAIFFTQPKVLSPWLKLKLIA